MFKRGYEASRAEKERQDQARENMGKKLWRFFLKDDRDEADLRFLNEEPVNFKEHNVKVGDHFESYTCTGDDCPFCADGDRPTYKGAYLVVDRREYEYTDKQTGKKKTGKNQVRLFVQGMKVVSQLDRIHERYGLSCRDVTVIRLGKGTQTSYTIERCEKEEMSPKTIRDLLPEKLRDQYDGSQDSLMDMVEAQLLMNVKDYDPSTDEDEDEEETTSKSSRGKLISYDEDEDEPEEKPRRKSGSLKSKFHRPQDSTKPKPRAKSLFKSHGDDTPEEDLPF